MLSVEKNAILKFAVIVLLAVSEAISTVLPNEVVPSVRPVKV